MVDVQLLINGVEPSIVRSISVVDEGKGKITFHVPHTVNVSVGDTVEVKVDGFTIARGTVFKIETERKRWRRTVHCLGRTDILYREYVLDSNHRVYANMDAGAIVKDLVDHYFSGILTSNNVNTSTGTTVDRIDGYGKTVGDVIEDLAERAGCCFYVDNSDDLHFFLEGAESSGLTINESDVHELKTTAWGESIGRVTVEGQSGFSASAGSGIPHIYIHDRRVRSITEASDLASTLLNIYNATRKSAEMTLYDFWNLHTMQSVIVNLPNDGYDNSTEIVRRVQWDFRVGKTFTTVTVGDENPDFNSAISRILRGLNVKRDDLDVYGERMHIRFTGESDQGYTISIENTGSYDISSGRIRLETGTGATGPNNPSSVYLYNNETLVDFGKNPSLRCKVKIGDDNDQYINLYVGQYGGYMQSFGFRVEGNTLYGHSRDASGSSQIGLKTITAGETLTLEAVYYSGSRIEFYVNGELLGTKTDYLPDISEKASQIFLWLSTSAAENKTLDVYYWSVHQDW